jgi:hypothetical protein
MLLPKKRRRASPLLVGLTLLAACRATGGARQPGRVPAAQGGAALSDPAAERVFQALAAALAEGEDELARHILAELDARPLGARERELVASAERVLRGRELIRGLELALVSEPVEGVEARFQLVLVARSRSSQAVRLRLPPCDLKRLSASMDARGFEGLQFESKVSAGLAQLALRPEVEERVTLLTYELPLGRALGVRERWRMETRSGEIDCAGAVFPAANVKVQGCERERLSPQVTAGPVPAGALAERLAEASVPSARELLELALRTERAEREPALRALAPVVAELARTRPGHVALAEPALRWLTQNRDLGADPAGWARYLAGRVAAGTAQSAPGGLDLPAHRGERQPMAGGAR